MVAAEFAAPHICSPKEFLRPCLLQRLCNLYTGNVDIDCNVGLTKETVLDLDLHMDFLLDANLPLGSVLLNLIA